MRRPDAIAMQHIETAGCVPDNPPGVLHCFRGAMNDQQELVRLQCRLILDDTVLTDANADQTRSNRAYAAYNYRTF